MAWRLPHRWRSSQCSDPVHLARTPRPIVAAETKHRGARSRPHLGRAADGGRRCASLAACRQWGGRRLHLWTDRARIRPDLQGDRDGQLRPGRHHDAGRILRVQPDRAFRHELLGRRAARHHADRRVRLCARCRDVASRHRPAAIRRGDADLRSGLYLPRLCRHHLGLRFRRLRDPVHQPHDQPAAA